jgi:cell division septal protein FtsQ
MVERTLADLKGSSLLQVDSTRIQRRLERLPHVHLLAYDRAFPNELRVRVSVERAVAVLRRGSDRWLLSAEGRVLRRLERPLRRPLPVVWGERSLEPEIGALLEAPEAAQAVDAVAAMQRVSPSLARRVWHVETEGGKLTAILHDRFEVRLGSSAELDLKIAVASRVVPALEPGEAAYADVSVPERPVVGATLDSQIEP